jgi:hypothetical protein
MLAPSGTEWTPCHVWLVRGREDDSIIEGYEESARKIWLAHVADMREHGASVLRVDEDGMRLAWDRAVARRAARTPMHERFLRTRLSGRRSCETSGSALALGIWGPKSNGAGVYGRRFDLCGSAWKARAGKLGSRCCRLG